MLHLGLLDVLVQQVAWLELRMLQGDCVSGRPGMSVGQAGRTRPVQAGRMKSMAVGPQVTEGAAYVNCACGCT